MTIRFRINGRQTRFDGAADMPLLWYLRDYAGLTGTKFGCGIAACGACTVHVDGSAVRACVLPMQALQDKEIRTIEDLGAHGLHAVQQAWIEQDVPQCGYCQSGQIMAAVDLLRRIPEPTDSDIATISNICRCGTYPRIRKAIHRAADIMKQGSAT
jgi:isoquinoline 1-oxidoreductase alpha subunit